MSYRTSALWGRCPALTLPLQLITPSRASGTADHVQSLDDLFFFLFFVVAVSKPFNRVSQIKQRVLSFFFPFFFVSTRKPFFHFFFSVSFLSQFFGSYFYFFFIETVFMDGKFIQLGNDLPHSDSYQAKDIHNLLNLTEYFYHPELLDGASTWTQKWTNSCVNTL